jgi:predicted GIY-YIG superfamily endonuclease
MLNHGNIVYVIRSVKDPSRYYTGLTDNVERRLAVHNSGGSAYTAVLRPWVLVAFTVFTDPKSAAEFEQYLKTGSGRAFSKRHLK